MSEHGLEEQIEDYHAKSFYLGVTFAFSEAVSFGCKKLALSYPYTPEELQTMLAPTQALAEEFGLKTLVDHAFLVTRLFPPALTEGKSVILLARSRDVIDEYLGLKEARQHAVMANRGDEIEDQLARSFGRLLSYSDEAIDRLMTRNSASHVE